MAPSKKIELGLIPPLNKVYYTGDDEISGNVRITFGKSVSVKKISVNLKAFSETITRTDSEYQTMQNGMLIQGPECRTFHNLIDLENRVFPPDNVWEALDGSSKPFKLNPGEYNYTFKFEKLSGKRPRCVKTHGPDFASFTKRNQTRLPPSFNNMASHLNKIDDLDLYFYTFGKILYIVQVNVELGKAKSWFNPFDKIMREQTLIEYIPNVKELKYEKHVTAFGKDVIFNNSSAAGFQTASLGEQLRNRNIRSEIAANRFVNTPTGTPTISRTNSNTIISPIHSPKISMSPVVLNGTQENLVSSSPAPTDFITINQASYRIGLPKNPKDNKMWLEVRTRNNGLEDLYRRDTLFRRGSNKLDRIYLVFETKDVDYIKNLPIKPVKVQLNLLENASFLSEGVVNENLSSLRLIGLDVADTASTILDLNELKPYPANPYPNSDGYYKLECQLKLKDHPSLRRLIFNEENYRHRGNLLYSFKSCAISRVFNLQLLVFWDLENHTNQTEVIIDDVQIYCQTRRRRPSSSRSNAEPDYLPRYVEPPTYGDIADPITSNGDIKKLD